MLIIKKVIALCIISVFLASTLINGMCFATPERGLNTLECELNNSFNTSNSIGDCGNTSASIGYSGDTDYFKFTASVSGSYTIETSGSTDTYLYLYNSDQNQVAINDNDGKGSNSRIEQPLTANQTYYIKINGSIGNYTLELSLRKELDVIAYSQQPYKYLCWATCAAMVISYFLNDKVNRTEEIGKDRYDRKDTIIPQWTNFDVVGFPKYGKTYVEEYCKDKVGTEGTVLSFDTVETNIDNLFPIYCRIEWIPDGGTHEKGGHMLVIKGYKVGHDGTMYIIYNDPWEGKEDIKKYDEFVKNDEGKWKWTHTVTYTNR